MLVPGDDAAIDETPVLATSGDDDEVTRAVLASALAADHPDPGASRAALVALADAWARTGAIAPAIEALRAAGVRDPSDLDVLDRLAPLLARAGRLASASQIARSAFDLEPTADRWRRAIRHAVHAADDTVADELLDLGLARFPDSTEVASDVIEVARTRTGHPRFAAYLMHRLRLTERRGEIGATFVAAVEAWVEGRGRVAADAVTVLALQRQDVALAFGVAVDGAARALRSGAPVEATALLELAARAAERLDDPDVRGVVASVRALLVGTEPLRDEARDVLFDAGHVLAATARLRTEARHVGDPVQAAAAWCGIAKLEETVAPERAIAALGEALAADATYEPARAHLASLAGRTELRRAVADALWWATRDELGATTARGELLAWLAQIEMAGEDVAGAHLAATRAHAAGITDVAPSADELDSLAHAETVGASAALAAFSAGDPGGVTRVAPGAWRDLDEVTRAIGSHAPADPRVADVWLGAQRRLGTAGSLAAAWQRIALRTLDPVARIRAVTARAEILDRTPAGREEALDALLSVLDPREPDADVARAVVALAEQGASAHAVRTAVGLLALEWPSALSHAVLARITGDAVPGDSPLAVVTRALDDSLAPHARSVALGQLVVRTGDVPALLSRQTRTLLAQSTEAAHALAVARRFAARVPTSLEACIAWFGAASVRDDRPGMTASAMAVAGAFASARDVSSVARTAISRLLAAGDRPSALHVAHAAVASVGLGDAALRTVVLDGLLPFVPADRTLHEALVAVSDDPAEIEGRLRARLVLDGAAGDALGERRVLLRLASAVPDDATVRERLETLLANASDVSGRGLALVRRIARNEHGAVGHESLELALAELFYGADRSADARTMLDRHVAAVNEPGARDDAVRLMLAHGDHDAAVDRLLAWGGTDGDDPASVVRLHLRAVELLAAGGAGHERQLATLRHGLARSPEAGELLVAAETIATASRATHAMLAIYDELFDLAAGEHGRRALAYRRARFLEAVGEPAAALGIYLAVFERTPASGALASAIERLANATSRHGVLVWMHEQLAAAATTNEARVYQLLAASRVSREHAHDPAESLGYARQALAIDGSRTTLSAVIAAAGAMHASDPATAREAVDSVLDDVVASLRDHGDEAMRRAIAREAFELGARATDDATRLRAVHAILTDGGADAETRAWLATLARDPHASAALREILPRTASMPAPAVDEDPVRLLLASGDRAGALAKARTVLVAHDDETTRALAERLAHELDDAPAQLDLIDQRLERTFDDTQRLVLSVRAAELLAGALAKPAEARRRLRAALARRPDDDRALDLLTRLERDAGDTTAVIELLARRAAVVTDPAVVRALRMERASMLGAQPSHAADAITEYEAVLNVEPGFRPALLALAALHELRGDHSLASECFSRAAATSRDPIESSSLLAQAAQRSVTAGEIATAMSQFRRALESDPSSESTVVSLLETGAKHNRLDLAEDAIGTVAASLGRSVAGESLWRRAVSHALARGAFERADAMVTHARTLLASESIDGLQALVTSARTTPGTAPGGSPARSESLRPSDLPRPSDAVELVPSVNPRDVEVRARPSIDPAFELRARPFPPRPHAPSDRPPAARPSSPPAAPVAPSSSPPPPASPSPLPGKLFAVGSSPSSAASVRPGPGSSAETLAAPLDEIPRAPLRPRSDAPPATASSPVLTTPGASSLPPARSMRPSNRPSGQTASLTVGTMRREFADDPTRLDVLDAMLPLLHTAGRHDEAAAVRAVTDAFAAREPAFRPRALADTPDPPPTLAGTWTLAPDYMPVYELGSILAEKLTTLMRRDLATYHVQGRDRILGGDRRNEIGKLFAHAQRILGAPGVAIYSRAEVNGGVMVTRTQPPAVLISALLAHDPSTQRFRLGQGIESTRPALVLGCALEPDERATLVEAIRVSFTPDGSIATALPDVKRMASTVVGSLTPRAQRRVTELLADLAAEGRPFSEALWVYACDLARARAGLVVLGDFAAAARLVVARYTANQRVDLRTAMATVPALHDLVRFAVSDAYVAMCWRGVGRAAP